MSPFLSFDTCPASSMSCTLETTQVSSPGGGLLRLPRWTGVQRGRHITGPSFMHLTAPVTSALMVVVVRELLSCLKGFLFVQKHLGQRRATGSRPSCRPTPLGSPFVSAYLEERGTVSRRCSLEYLSHWN